VDPFSDLRVLNLAEENRIVKSKISPSRAHPAQPGRWRIAVLGPGSSCSQGMSRSCSWGEGAARSLVVVPATPGQRVTEQPLGTGVDDHVPVVDCRVASGDPYRERNAERCSRRSALRRPGSGPMSPLPKGFLPERLPTGGMTCYLKPRESVSRSRNGRFGAFSPATSGSATPSPRPREHAGATLPSLSTPSSGFLQDRQPTASSAVDSGAAATNGGLVLGRVSENRGRLPSESEQGAALCRERPVPAVP
jgi:hypothetical protein